MICWELLIGTAEIKFGSCKGAAGNPTSVDPQEKISTWYGQICNVYQELAQDTVDHNFSLVFWGRQFLFDQRLHAPPYQRSEGKSSHRGRRLGKIGFDLYLKSITVRRPVLRSIIGFGLHHGVLHRDRKRYHDNHSSVFKRAGRPGPDQASGLMFLNEIINRKQMPCKNCIKYFDCPLSMEGYRYRAPCSLAGVIHEIVPEPRSL